jgi:hypothetical protein
MQSKKVWAYFLLGVMTSTAAQSEPSRVAREIHTGIVYPSLHRASQENASGLIQDEVVAVHGKYGPPILDADSHIGNFVGTLSYTNLAISLGYQAEVINSTTLQKFFTGGAFRYSELSFGAGMTTPVDEGEFNPSLHAGFAYDFPAFRLGLMFDRLDNTDYTQALIGAGFGATHALNFEVNVRTPPFSGFTDPGATHEYLAGLAFYNQRIGLGGQGGVSVEKQSNGTNNTRGKIEVTAMYRIIQSLASTLTYQYRRGHFILLGLTLSMKLPGMTN